MNLEQVIKELFIEAQKKLPEVDRAAVALKGDEMCLAEEGGYKCTKVKGHAGDHIAHSQLGNVCYRWAAAPPLNNGLGEFNWDDVRLNQDVRD